MRLIDADKLRQSAIEITGESEFAFDNCFPYWQFAKAINDAEEVKAIPIEWIENYYKFRLMPKPVEWFEAIEIMLTDWEKENGKDSE